jgi:hypothetical protein
MPRFQTLQPLPLALALVPHHLLRRPIRLPLQLAQHLGLVAALKATPLLGVVFHVGRFLHFVERVVQRVGVTHYAHDAACGIALDFDFAHLEETVVARLVVERVGCYGWGWARAGGGSGAFLLDAAGGVAQAGDEAEAAVVLGEGFFLVPGGVLEIAINDWPVR